VATETRDETERGDVGQIEVEVGYDIFGTRKLDCIIEEVGKQLYAVEALESRRIDIKVCIRSGFLNKARRP
jgi:hypothetical protein